MDQELHDPLDHLKQQIEASAAETRRYMDVVAGRLTWELRLVIERLAALNHKVDRLREEVHEAFRRVDQRFLRLESRVTALERRRGWMACTRAPRRFSVTFWRCGPAGKCGTRRRGSSPGRVP